MNDPTRFRNETNRNERMGRRIVSNPNRSRSRRTLCVSTAFAGIQCGSATALQRRSTYVGYSKVRYGTVLTKVGNGFPAGQDARLRFILPQSCSRKAGREVRLHIGGGGGGGGDGLCGGGDGDGIGEHQSRLVVCFGLVGNSGHVDRKTNRANHDFFIIILQNQSSQADHQRTGFRITSHFPALRLALFSSMHNA